RPSRLVSGDEAGRRGAQGMATRDEDARCRMKTEDIVRERIVELWSVDAEEVTLVATLRDDLGADSIDMVELVMDLDDAFRITIPDEDAEAWRTFGDVVAYVERMKAAARPEVSA